MESSQVSYVYTTAVTTAVASPALFDSLDSIAQCGIDGAGRKTRRSCIITAKHFRVPLHSTCTLSNLLFPLQSDPLYTAMACITIQTEAWSFSLIRITTFTSSHHSHHLIVSLHPYLAQCSDRSIIVVVSG